jgi:Ca2+-binding RTX toxin-like protein
LAQLPKEVGRVTVLRNVAAVAVAALALILAPGASAQGPPGSPQVNINQALPAIGNDQVTVLGPSTAIVQIGVDPNNLATQVHVEYGTTTLLGQTTPTVDIAAGGDPVKLIQELTSLKPGTSYYYKVVAENSNGTTTTTTNTFRTAAPTRVDPATGMPTTSAKGVSCTITGTAKGDKLKGTSKKDVICGLGGNDRVSGGKGNDQIIGGTGNDRLNGGAGKDRLLGNAGKDRLTGAAGADRIDGGAGNDKIIGSTGKDRLAGGAGNDRITADDNKGGDRVKGDKGRDRAVVNRGDKVTKKSTEKVTRKGGKKSRKHKKRHH